MWVKIAGHSQHLSSKRPKEKYGRLSFDYVLSGLRYSGTEVSVETSAWASRPCSGTVKEGSTRQCNVKCKIKLLKTCTLLGIQSYSSNQFLPEMCNMNRYKHSGIHCSIRCYEIWSCFLQPVHSSVINNASARFTCNCQEWWLTLHYGSTVALSANNTGWRITCCHCSSVFDSFDCQQLWKGKTESSCSHLCSWVSFAKWTSDIYASC